MRTWSWSKGAIRVDDGNGFEAVFDFFDFWNDHGDQKTEEIAEFIVSALNEKEQRAFDQKTGRIMSNALRNRRMADRAIDGDTER